MVRHLRRERFGTPGGVDFWITRRSTLAQPPLHPHRVGDRQLFLARQPVAQRFAVDERHDVEDRTRTIAPIRMAGARSCKGSYARDHICDLHVQAMADGHDTTKACHTGNGAPGTIPRRNWPIGT